MPDLEPSTQKSNNFLLVWIIAALSIIAFAAIVIPNIAGYSIKAKAASIRGSMRTVQIAAESYATDTGGTYPRTYDELARYLPGGSNTLTGKPGVLLNPATGKPDLLVVSDAFSTSEKIQSIKTKSGLIRLPQVRPGQIVYSWADKGNSYAITQVNADGTVSGGIGGNVLSNQ